MPVSFSHGRSEDMIYSNELFSSFTRSNHNLFLHRSVNDIQSGLP